MFRRAIGRFLIAMVVATVAAPALLPAQPSQRAERDAAAMRRIEAESFAAIRADPGLMTVVREAGARLFAEHCAACHGADAAGGKGVSSLRAGSWRWGGDPETIVETIRVGINASHRDTRMSQMAPFGPRGLLTRPEAESVVAYVRTLSDPAAAREGPAERIDEGRAIFASDCASCHGADGKGKRAVGAPDLTDPTWTHGGDPEAIFASVWSGRKGEMPAWEDRLGPAERKILALHVIALQ
ncbi:MAG: cytochrome-c oxidase, cbb3-type subunit III [Alphaproteobacteria bacterium]|nr:cytochrome-c oxidase, cbb3-type subunit III [Alphaproteobacteria bacterium]